VSDALHTLGVQPENDPQSLLAGGDLQVYETAEFAAEAQASRPVEADDSRPALEVAEAEGHESASKRYGSVVMPDLIGRGIREAARLCAAQRIKLNASGDGVVSLQSPPPGTLVPENTICRVKLSKAVIRKNPLETATRPPASSGDPPRVGARAN
jgi:hypothetical protein